MRLSIWIGILALAAVLPVTAQVQPQTGSVRVRVRVEGTQKTIAGAKVTLTPSTECTDCLTDGLLDLPKDSQDLLAYLTKLAASRGIADGEMNIKLDGFPPGAPMTAVTDADGNAVIQGVKPGRYTVSVQHSEYVGVPVKRSDGFVGAVSPTSVSDRVTVDPARLSPQAEFFLSPVSSVSGRVRNPDGSPAANVNVVLGKLRLDAGSRVFVVGMTAKTDTTGEFLLTGVGSAEYLIRVVPATAGSRAIYYPGDADIENATLIFVGPGKALVGIDITLP